MLRFTPLPTSNVPPSLLAGRRLALIQPLLTVRLVPTHGCVAVMQPSRSLRPRQRSGHSRSCDRAPCSERTAKSARLLRQKTRPLVESQGGPPSYVGDATIGEHSNIGAGSVFANYDGVNKHHSFVGSHVRTGSHGVFVAPVRIADGVYTGAGTVVRQDVPAGALAVNIAPQRNIEGWVGKFRAGTDTAAPAAAAAETSGTN